MRQADPETYVKHPDRPTVVVDFDGVLNTYDGWAGQSELFEPREDAEELLKGVTDQGFRVVVLSTRPKNLVERWLTNHGLSPWVANVTTKKPPAVAYIDDRAVFFDGDVGAVLEALDGFHAHWEEEEEDPGGTGTGQGSDNPRDNPPDNPPEEEGEEDDSEE